MIKRKTILSIFILIFLTINLVGCKNLSQQTKEDIYEDFQKKITKMTSYTCQADITVFNNKSQSKYTINHTYKIIIKNKQLDDVVELPNVGDNKLYLFIGDFVQDFMQKDSINIKDSDEQLILEKDISQESNYLSKQILYIDKKTKNPVKVEILNNEGEKKFIVNYTNFQSEH